MNMRKAPGHGISPLLLIPVPWVFLLTYLLGVGLQHFVPLTISAPSVQLISHIAGIVFMSIGVPLAAWSLGIFRTVGTTTVPFETSSSLVVGGRTASAAIRCTSA